MSKWKMPKWMEKYRACIVGNGESVEDMMNDNTAYQINGPRAIIAAGVKTQVALLFTMRENGLLE